MATVLHHFIILVRLYFANGLLRGDVAKGLLLFRDMLLVPPSANDFCTIIACVLHRNCFAEGLSQQPPFLNGFKSGFFLIQPSSSERVLKISKNLLKIRQNFSVSDVSVVMTLSSLIVLNPSATDLLST